MKTIIENVRYDGKWYYAKALGIIFKFIEREDIIKFMQEILETHLTFKDKGYILPICSRRNIKKQKARSEFKNRTDTSHPPDSLA